MSSRSSSTEARHGKKRKGADLMSQMGLGVPQDMDAMSYKDADLEAEFAALTGGDVPGKKSSTKNNGQVSVSEIEQLAAQSLRDDDDDDDVSDTEDPQLMAELAELQKSGSEADTVPGHTTVKHSMPAEAEGGGDTVDSNKNKAPSTEEAFELPPEPTAEESQKLFQAPAAPRTVMEALTQRLEKYRSSKDSATQAGDTGKARRMGRIVKQYEKAMKDYQAGKTVQFEGLPTPPGFGPIPVDSNPPHGTAPSLQGKSTSPSETAATTTTSPVHSNKTVTTTATVTIARTALPPISRSDHQPPDRDTGPDTAVKAKPALRRGLSRQEYQLDFLQERVEEFRKAALRAKRMGHLDTAKQHLRSMKGVEKMIETLKRGQPIDLSQVPPSPAVDNSEDKHLVVSADDVIPARDRDALFTQLEQDLIAQMRVCATNSQHFTKVGDVPAASKFQKLEQGCRKDLELLKTARSRGDPVPKFHYEARTFSVIQCHSDLGDGEMELTVIRGITLSLPSGFSEKDMDTVVKYEFAFPIENGQTGQTSTVKGTVNPEYGGCFKLQIDRKARSFARFVERKGIKLEIYIKRGFLKGDKLLGTTTVKLSPLDTKCTLHDSYDLTEGRKSVGGKLEVKVRVREPFKGRQVDQSQEKWLVIDQFIHTVGLKTQGQGVQKNKNAKSSICTLS